VSLDAPLAEVGEITDERPVEKGVRGWRTFLPQSRKIFAYVMNNYWHTNYKADQEGPVLVRFVVRPHPRINASDIVRMGIEAARPLVVVPAAASGVPWSGVGLEAEPSSVLVVSLKPSRDGRSVMARLYNPTDRPVDALLGGRFVQGAAVWRSSPFEDRREALSGPLLMMPYETVALRIDSR
jgi:alpha-mannosidase